MTNSRICGYRSADNSVARFFMFFIARSPASISLVTGLGDGTITVQLQ